MYAPPDINAYPVDISRNMPAERRIPPASHKKRNNRNDGEIDCRLGLFNYFMISFSTLFSEVSNFF